MVYRTYSFSKIGADRIEVNVTLYSDTCFWRQRWRNPNTKSTKMAITFE